MRKILFATSEAHPLVKTGGLADVSASLPQALVKKGLDVRIILPAYRECLEKLTDIKKVATLHLDGYHLELELLESKLPDSDVVIWLLHSPHHYEREGKPYSKPDGTDWDDNAARFALLSRATAKIAMNEASLNWQPDILHCNDWQTGLAPALIADREHRPRILYTIHNLAYQGLYSKDVFTALDLPEKLWHQDGLEFYGQMSFMKGGLIFADHINTVSPSYAQEICQAEYGYGLEGLLSYRSQQGRLTGILNGIDYEIWNPKKDALIASNYSLENFHNKLKNKAYIQKISYLPPSKKSFLLALISRLVPQKGVDLAIEAVTNVLTAKQDVQFICLGSGDPHFEYQLNVLRAKFPDRVAVSIGYNEALSHQIEAGADAFLMPSRFEPCGLNQMYSLRYGTLPIVRHTGGLSDTVVNATEENRKANTANGFSFYDASVSELEGAILHASALFKRPRIWRNMIKTAMTQDLSWQHSADAYIDLYHRI